MNKPAFQKKPTNAPIDPALALMRIPPHSVEAEQSLLGGLLLDNSAFDKIADRVSERMASRRQGNLDAEFDDLADDSQADSSEIPAFLRRQAN